MIKAYKAFWKNYLTYEGKSSRSDYWWVFLVNSIIRALIISSNLFVMSYAIASRVDGSSPQLSQEIGRMTASLLAHPTAGMMAVRIVGVLFSLAVMTPVTTLTARRLRDAHFAPSLVYPLPAVYLLDQLMEFVALPGGGFLSTIFIAYTLALLFLCTTRSRSEADFTGRI